jgi:hypothetical protein
MAPGIGAAGIMGIALETVAGTYTAPTKYVPFMSEGLNFTQATRWRRPIRNTPDVVGGVPGDAHVEGDMSIEALHDVVAILMHTARTSVVKTGAGPYKYVFSPTSGAIPAKTCSITMVKNGIVFGYTGMVISEFTFTIEEGALMFNPSFLGRDEAVQSAPTPTWPTSAPFGAGMYNVQIPTASQVFDTDTFEFTVNDNGEPQFRLKDTGRGAQFIKYGEREVGLSLARDFESRTDYDAFKALTAQAIKLSATNGANSIIIDMLSAIKDSYEVANNSQGDLVRAEIEYIGTLGASGVPYTVEVNTTENITP